MQKKMFIIKARDSTIEQRSNNILMIGKHWNNQYCYSRLILQFILTLLRLPK